VVIDPGRERAQREGNPLALDLELARPAGFVRNDRWSHCVRREGINGPERTD
jgi:hypothetical protein